MAENKSKRQFIKQTHNSSDHIRIPRQPKKPERADNILYVCSKTNIKAQLEKCNKLVNNRENEIIIYCMGAAIQRGILLALQICEENIAYKLHTNTLTTELIDDLEPAVDDADYDIQRRFNSALRIRIFNSNSIE
ncbi:unnamed protein product [Psylliodes chrysocephalus]|uniref:Ribonuclease P protein subunit p20 n=1 Tax=Psylliodes chrysocephalus TaxID=3402493 RepID=A0A9P0DAU1_9CUCU|nr:unnamed protein product [Psylliodes chrysocephala]